MPQIIGPALGGELLASELLEEAQVNALLKHATSFPTYPLNRLFLEYEVDEGLSLKGYGHGYTLEQFSDLVSEESELCPERADPLRSALERDPFSDERGYYMNDRLPDDPEWIEYDWSAERFESMPAVFYMIPKRLRSFASPERLDSLCSRLVDLPGDPLGENRELKEDDVDLVSLLAALRTHTPASHAEALSIYRLGLSDARAPGWMKLVLSGIDADAIRGACAEYLDVLNIFPRIVSIYEQFGDAKQTPIIAASIDSLHGVVHGVDVECPYFHGIEDPNLRRTAVGIFSDGLVADGLLSEALANIVKRNAYLELETDDQEALLTLNHMKFGIAGATQGRLKLYFELMTRRRGA